jgi:sec-independent protein translocase protein TatB
LFGIGGWEFILIAVLALLLFGPDKLPQFARTVGRFLRDLKRYQDLMESTIRAEVYANDAEKKDPFKTGKEFRERVASGGFAKPVEPEAAEVEASEGEAPDQEAPVEPTSAAEEASTESADASTAEEPAPESGTPDADADGGQE